MDPLSVAGGLINLLEISNALAKSLSEHPTESTKLNELEPTLRKLILMLEDVRRIFLMNPNLVAANTYLQFNDACQTLSTTLQEMMDLVGHLFKPSVGSIPQQQIKQMFLEPRVVDYVNRTTRALDLLQAILMVIFNAEKAQSSHDRFPDKVMNHKLRLPEILRQSQAGQDLIAHVETQTAGAHPDASTLEQEAQFLRNLSIRQRKLFEKATFISSKNVVISLCFDERSTQALAVTKPLSFEHWWERKLQSLFKDAAQQRSTSMKANMPSERKSEFHAICCGIDFYSSNGDNIPFDKPTYMSLMEKLDLPRDFTECTVTGTPMFKWSMGSKGSDNVKFVLRMPLSSTCNWTLCVSWHRQQHQIYNLVHGFSESDFVSFQASLQEDERLKPHPLTAFVLLCDQLIQFDASEIKRHASNLYDVELRTNYLEIDSLSSEGPNSDNVLEDLTRKLNTVLSRLHFHEMRMYSCSKLIDHISKLLKSSDWEAWRCCPGCFVEAEASIRTSIANVDDERSALELEIHCNQKLAENQLRILYNLIAQRDNLNNLRVARLSTEIAQLTKDDSFAMRTIAIMTMVFLPATAVSSLFSMTMFNWQGRDGDEPILSPYFWVYWAVAIPMTLIVFLVWTAWTHFHRKGPLTFLPANENSRLLPGRLLSQKSSVLRTSGLKEIDKSTNKSQNLKNDVENGALAGIAVEAIEMNPVLPVDTFRLLNRGVDFANKRVDSFVQGPKR